MKPAYLALILMALLLSSCSSSTTSAPDATPVPTAVTQPVGEPTATSSVSASPTAAAAAPTVAEPTATLAAQSTPSLSGAACQNVYYPVVQGASWQYQLSGVTNDTFTRTISAVRADGFDDQDTFSAGTTRTASWACQDGNIIALTPSSEGPTVSAADMQFDFTVESNDGISFPADPQPGQTWTQNIVYLGQQNVGGTTIQSRNVLENSCKVGNIETVNVPAGEFQALRVDCTTKIDIYISDTLAFTLNSSNAAWHAPQVGMVKSSGSSDIGATDIVLLAYSIP